MGSIIINTEEVVGKDHPSKARTLDRAVTTEHGEDGVHFDSYASLYEDNPAGTIINITTGGTYVKWSTSTAGPVAGGTLITSSTSTDDITIGNDGEGVYDIFAGAAIAGPAGLEVFIAVHVDGIRQGQLTRSVHLGGAHEHFPDSVDLKIGSVVTGDASTLQSIDATYLQFTETATPTGFIADFTFTDVVAPLLVKFNGRYSGNSGDFVEGQIYDADTGADRVKDVAGTTAYNCIRAHDTTVVTTAEPGVGADWTSYWEADGAASGEPTWSSPNTYDDAFDELRSDTKDLPYSASADYVRRWLISGTHADRKKYVDSNGNCRMRFIHTTAGNATHNTYVDAISLEDDHSEASVTISDLLDLTATDVVDIRFTTDEDASALEITNVNFKTVRKKIS